MCSVFQLLALTLTIFTQEKVDKKKNSVLMNVKSAWMITSHFLVFGFVSNEKYNPKKINVKGKMHESEISKFPAPIFLFLTTNSTTWW